MRTLANTEDAARLVERLRCVGPDSSRFIVRARDGRIRHSIFGPMTSAEWLRWGHLHLDHHLRQFGA